MLSRRVLSLDDVDPTRAAVAIAAGRLLIGAAMLTAPRALTRPALRPPVVGRAVVADETAMALRMVAGRDVALALGALLAARRGSTALRGWIEAAALADGVDAGALAATRSLRRWVRVVGGTVAAATAGAGAVTARRLTG